MSDVFQVDVTMKMHLSMWHVHHHLVHLGCIQRGSFEENKIAQKQFKILYNGTNKDLDCIATQLSHAMGSIFADSSEFSFT